MPDHQPRTPDRVWTDWDLVERAMALANRVHRSGLRKDSPTPYLAHVWSVAALVLEYGGTDTQVAAALLHDAVEDEGGLAMLTEIGRDISPLVAALVEHLSDSVVDTTAGETKDPWPIRKARYLAGLARASDEVLLVSACDKLHNARCVLADFRAVGPEVWDRFNEKDAAYHVWYYDTLVTTFEGRIPPALSQELKRTVEAIVELIEADEGPGLVARVASRRRQAAALLESDGERQSGGDRG